MRHVAGFSAVPDSPAISLNLITRVPGASGSPKTTQAVLTPVFWCTIVADVP